MRRSAAGAAPSKKSDPKKKDREHKGVELKIPMPDPVTEQVIIAAAVVDLVARKKLCAVFSIDYFFADGHSEAWGVILELERQGLAYDPATVRQLSGGKVDTDYLDGLAQQRPAVPPNINHHIEVLRWDRARIEGIRGPVSGLVDAISDPTTKPEIVTSLARAIVSTFEGHGSLKYLRAPGQLVRAQMEEIKRRRAGDACYPFGLEGFDQYSDGDLAGQWRMIPGLSPGDMTVLTGAPGCGKTTITARIAVEQANQQRRVLFGAWEQGSGLTLELCASVSLHMSRTALSTGAITDEDELSIEAEMERLSEWIRFFEVPFDRGAAETVKKWEINDKRIDTIYEYLVATAPDVAIFDLYRRALGDFDPDAEERALTRQQAMLQETKCHGLLIHQMKKEAEGREDKRPSREGLKGSAAWFEVPTTVIGIYREAMWKAVPDDRIAAYILKQRKGVFPLAVEFPWNGDRGELGVGVSAEVPRPGTKSHIDGFLDGDMNPAQMAASRERRKEAKGGGRKRLNG